MKPHNYAWPIATIATCLFCAAAWGAAAGRRSEADRERIGELLRVIATAGKDPRPLNPQRVETLFGLRIQAQCDDFISSQGHVYSCRYDPIRPQTGPIKFLQYETARLVPGPMAGGNVEWKVDVNALCLKRQDLQRVFGVAPGPALFLDDA